ncbi:MAG: MMPL family transporter [Mycobacteriales bacterium]
MVRILTGAARRHPVVTLVVWLLVIGAGFGLGGAVFGRMTSSVGAVPGSESRHANQLIDAAHLDAPVITAVVTGRPATDPALRAALDDVRATPGVAGVSGPDESRGAVKVDVTFREDGDDAAGTVADRLRRVDPDHVTVAGGPLTDDDFNRQAQSDTSRAETLSTPVLLVLLLLVFGAVLAAGLPLLVAVAGTGGTFGLLYAFSFLTDVSIYAIQVTTMLSIGLAVDYALLLVSRFREERARAATPAAALDRTCLSAGRTVLFSGLTVSVSLAGMLVFPDPFLRSLGLAGACVVAIDMLAALTLLPALLALFGHRIKPARRDAARGGRVFAAVARRVQRRPAVALLLTAVALLAVAWPAVGMRLSKSDPRALPAGSQTRKLHDTLVAHFPHAGGPDPIVLVASAGADDPALADLQRRVSRVPGVAAVSRGATGHGITLLEATPDGGTSSPRTARTVARLRDLPAPVPVSVTGDAARLVDYRAQLADRLPWSAGVVVLGSFLLLFAFTGSVLLPLKAVASTLLSIGAAFGAVVWVFQEGHLAGWFGTSGLDGVDLTVPVVVAAIAFGLSMDYEVFLLSRIRERWLLGDGADRSVVEGLRRSGRIITAAAMLLIVAFAGFLTAGFAPIKEVGLGLVLAVAIDATVVRMVLVPAAMTLLGRYAWWAPRRLGRVPVVQDADGPAEVIRSPRSTSSQPVR